MAEIGDRVFRKDSTSGGDPKLTAMMVAVLGLRDLVAWHLSLRGF